MLTKNIYRRCSICLVTVSSRDSLRFVLRLNEGVDLILNGFAILIVVGFERHHLKDLDIQRLCVGGHEVNEHVLQVEAITTLS